MDVLGTVAQAFEAWFAQWKPGDFSISLVVFTLLGFFMFRVWPWLTTVYIPAVMAARQKSVEAIERREAAQDKILHDISENLVRLTVLVEQQVDQTRPRSRTTKKEAAT